MPQNAQQANPAINPSGTSKPLKIDATSNLLTGQGLSSRLNVAAATVIKTGAGRACKVNVTVAGAVGAIYDFAATSGVSAATLIGVVPAVVGIYNFDFPFTTGLVYVPGASQVASISYT